MINEALSVFYFFLPAMLGNMSAVLFGRVPFFSWPLDFGATLRGKRLFGDHKTWRGLLVGVAVGMLVFYLQQFAYHAGFVGFALYSYDALHVLLGAALAFGALVGDALESTVKRQLGVAPGESLLFWDQLDFFFGAMLVSIPYWLPVWVETLVVALAVFALTIVTQKVGYWTGVKDDPL